jgi:hypothetical protein
MKLAWHANTEITSNDISGIRFPSKKATAKRRQKCWYSTRNGIASTYTGGESYQGPLAADVRMYPLSLYPEWSD